MKPQDIIFVIFVLTLLLLRKQPVWYVGGALGLFIAAIPLYAQWIFFTAERFVWYAVFLLFLSILMQIYYARVK